MSTTKYMFDITYILCEIACSLSKTFYIFSFELVFRVLIQSQTSRIPD